MPSMSEVALSSAPTMAGFSNRHARRQPRFAASRQELRHHPDAAVRNYVSTCDTGSDYALSQNS